MSERRCCYCGATEGIDQDAYGVWGCTDNNAERCRRRCADLDAEEAQVSEPCIYCGGADGRRGRIGRDGWAHGSCTSPFARARVVAEYAALAAGLDAVVAAYERRVYNALVRIRTLRTSDRTAATYMRHQRDAALDRADAAEARIAEQDRLIHDGLYALMGERHAALTRAAAVWEERALAAEAQLAQAREDGARSVIAFSQAHPEVLIEIHLRHEGQPHEFYRNELVAAWRAAQTEAAE